MRESRLEQSQMYYKNVLAKKITEDVNFVPAYEEAMEKIEARIPHVIQLISHDQCIRSLALEHFFQVKSYHNHS